MIVPSMTKAELLREVKEDSDWVFERRNGIRKKYNKRLKKFDGEILLGISTYKTPRYNEAIVVWVASNVNKHEFNLSCFTYFKYNTPAGVQYILATRYAQSVVVYTVHFIKRLKEREGLSFIDFIQLLGKEASYLVVPDKYVYKGKEVEVVPFLDRGFQIFKEDNWGMNMLTYISKSQYQGEQGEFIKKVVEEQSLENDKYLAYLKR